MCEGMGCHTLKDGQILINGFALGSRLIWPRTTEMIKLTLGVEPGCPREHAANLMRTR